MTTYHNINGHQVAVPTARRDGPDFWKIVDGGMFDHLEYRGVEIHTCDEGVIVDGVYEGPFYIVDSAGEFIEVSDLPEASRLINANFVDEAPTISWWLLDQPGVQPDAVAAKMITTCAAALEEIGDVALGDL